jgi:hydroxymethylpyrimidine/phosphomethylpyrimidine kinase
VLEDIGVNAVKIGMLHSPEIVLTVAIAIERHALPHVVFDPVMVATSGGILADADTIAAFDRLMALAALTTPNLPELAALGGEEAVLTKTDALLIKGGHSESALLTDRLVLGHQQTLWTSARIDTRHTHGTGCTLASAIATGLGQGLPLPEAVARGREFVRSALLAAPGFGAGHGPLGHQAVR